MRLMAIDALAFDSRHMLLQRRRLLMAREHIFCLGIDRLTIVMSP
jgi:hypothetical protein